MNSFYEQPRTAPVPTATEKIAAIPVVPEVSMIFQNPTKGECEAPDSIYLSYNAWKARNQSENSVKHNYGLHSLQQAQLNRSRGCISPPGLTKQVRFESPVMLQQRQKLPPVVDVARSAAAPFSNNSQFSHRLQSSVKENAIDTSLPVKPNKFVKPFEQIYMANIPNRHLDLSIIEPPRAPARNRENLENISPNVNLGNNAFKAPLQQNVKQSVGPSKNCFTYSKDVPSQSPMFDHYTVNNKNKFNDYQHPEKLNDCFEAQITQYRKGIGCDFQQPTGADKNDPLEKNRVIDLYNYKRGGFEASNTAYGHRQTLNNLEFVNNRITPGLPDSQQKECHPNKNNCLYDSFDSHNCENNKHICSCSNNKELPANHRHNTAIQTEIVPVSSNSCKNVDVNVVNKNDEPTVKDLLKIIHQQNDQLLILQKQVAALLNNRDAPKQIEAPPASDRNINLFGEKCRTSTQLETQPGLCNPLQKCLPRKGPLPQFSVDVMTSFEVSIRRQQNLNRAFKDAMNHPPKICEVTETDSNAFDQTRNTNANNIGNILDGICNKHKLGDDTEVSLTLNEPVQVRETCHTPENTVSIVMDDYNSDTDDENSSDERWFYKNVKGQVSQILRKSGIWPNSGSPSDISENCNDVATQNIRKKVKEATVKHLKSIGVHVPVLDDPDNLTETDSPHNMGYNPNEVSFAVKQLLMKYLPNEQLAKLAYAQTQNVAPQHGEQASPGLIKRRPEFSFATVQYMQKYNLLTDVPNGRNANQQPRVPPLIHQDENFDRILDITAIKQQRKLL